MTAADPRSTKKKKDFVFGTSYLFYCPLTPPSSSLFLSKGSSTSTGELDKLVSPAALTPESEEEQLLPPQRVSTFRPRPYSMADSNKVPNHTYERLRLI